MLAPVAVASLPASSSVATEVVTQFLGPRAGGVMAAALAMSVFGSLQIVSLVSARIPYAMAEDGLFFKGLARLSPNTRVPIRALVAQAAWSIVLVFSGSYDTLTDYAIFAVLIFVALATASVFLFRRRLPDAERAYRTLGYPVVPILFLVVAGWLIVNTFLATPQRALAGIGLMLAGLPFYWYWSRQSDTHGCSREETAAIRGRMVPLRNPYSARPSTQLRAGRKNTPPATVGRRPGSPALDGFRLATTPWPDFGASGVFFHLTPARRAPRDFSAKPSAPASQPPSTIIFAALLFSSLCKLDSPDETLEIWVRRVPSGERRE